MQTLIYHWREYNLVQHFRKVSLVPSKAEDTHNLVPRETIQLIIQIQIFLRIKGVILMITLGQQA